MEDVGACVVPRAIVLPMHAFGFEGRKEAFGDGVVPHIARATHAARDADIAQQALEVFARVLRAAVGVVDERRRASATPDGHHERIRDELRGHGGLHRPPHDAS